MADSIVSNLVEFKLRRTAAGIVVTVLGTDAFETSLKNRARADIYDRADGNGGYVDTWNVRENPTPSDPELGYFLFMKGSAAPGGKSVTVPFVRSRDQLLKVAEEVSAWTERHFANYMRAVEVTAVVKARTIFGLLPAAEGESPVVVEPAPLF